PVNGPPPIHPSCPPAVPFFLHPPTDPRPPRSFPTRRSSDLTVPSFANGTCTVVVPVPAVLRKMPVLWTSGATAPQQLTTRKASPDRKSTRLNSSHLGNAYAVCCMAHTTHDNVPSFRNVRPPS